MLGLVRQGVYAELAKDLREDLSALLYCLRMPDAVTQRGLLEETVARLPAWDARQFHRVASNVVANVAARVALGAVDTDLAAKVSQLGRDLAEFLPEHRLDAIAAPADSARGLGPGGRPRGLGQGGLGQGAFLGGGEVGGGRGLLGGGEDAPHGGLEPRPRDGGPLDDSFMS